MAEAQVNGARLNYRQTGAGPDVVLVHGLAANQAFWNLAIVSALAREYRVTTLDLRGHGYSEMTAEGYAPVNLARDLLGLLDHLAIARAHLVGHSFGGLVSLCFTLEHPARVYSLTLADSRLRSLQQRQAVTQREDWPRIQAALAEHGVTIDENDPYVGLCLFQAIASLQKDDAARVLAGEDYVPFGTGTRSARHWLKLVTTTTLEKDFRGGGNLSVEQLAAVRVPVLAVYGAESPTRETGERIDSVIPDCRKVWVPGARHFHPATHPEFFRDALLGFLHEVSRPAAP